ncbi:hypothetical protein SAMN05443572_110192 [Myxococcus fulvus]|jgi:hypothetical protein|uniref:Lipoprotein n=1 Tax=Myxococcus fulvus TaxID=33 RepID=A0ABY1CS72_MYXFU|nr:hypothetical protein SAMN05443572_110192 [Myxococcus fulvus]
MQIKTKVRGGPRGCGGSLPVLTGTVRTQLP